MKTSGAEEAAAAAPAGGVARACAWSEAQEEVAAVLVAGQPPLLMS